MIFSSNKCTDGVCSINYPLLPDSLTMCPHTTNLSVTVYGTNILGDGFESMPVHIAIIGGYM